MASTPFGGSTESRNKNKQDKTKATTGNTRVQPHAPSTPPSSPRTEGGITAPKANKNIAGTYRNGSAAPAAPKYTLLPKKVPGK